MGFEIFNVGSNKAVSLKDLTKIYENETQRKVKYTLKILNHAELKTTSANNKKVKGKFSWKPKYDIKDIIRSIVNKN